MDSDEGDAESTEPVSVLFLDVRNFTLLLDNFDDQEVTGMLDFLFGEVRDTIEQHGGAVDKVVGDGIMAVFESESAGPSALRAATEIHQNATDRTERLQNTGAIPINIGIGIATGTVNEATLADIDSTVIGRCVNIAARLEGLCKEYDASILVDEATYQSSTVSDLENDYVARRIPDENIRGIQENLDVYHICDTTDFSEEYIQLFNEGVTEYVNQNYERALNAFTEAYTLDERFLDQSLLNHFTNSCLNKIDDNRSLFRNPEQYEEHSSIQQEQSNVLMQYIEDSLIGSFTPTKILDVGCGTGKVTEKLAETYSQATVVAIDSSRSAIAKARTEHNPDHLDIDYRCENIENYCPSEEENAYDLIFSNTTMHWEKDQHSAYTNLRKLISEDGLLAIHQGHNGTYEELHEVAVDLIYDFDYDRYFDDLNPPQDLIYYTEEDMKHVLEKHDFEPFRIKTVQDSAPETIFEDFESASLNAYCDRLKTQSQRDIFREQFKIRAEQRLDPVEVTVHRIYALARPNGG
jgi:class 3 adenylate cyclase/trans-aconitate methyltransferase